MSKSVQIPEEGYSNFQEMVEDIGEDEALGVMFEGRLPPEINKDTGEILIDSSEDTGDPVFDYQLRSKKREGAKKALAPLDLLFHDIPYMIGKKSSRVGDAGKEFGKKGDILRYSTIPFLGAAAAEKADLIGNMPGEL